MYNWQNIYEDMLKNNACIVSNNIRLLEEKIKKLFENKKEMDRMKKNSKKLSQKKFFRSDELIYIIKNLIEVSPC